MDEGLYREVIELCDRALLLNPDRIDADYLKALARIRLREYEHARYILEKLQKKIGEREYINKAMEELPK
jgi:tetratricopeptide (TPR) repeat protein